MRKTPTLKDVENYLGGKIGKSFFIKPRRCRDVQKFINRIEEVFKETKKTSIQFD